MNIEVSEVESIEELGEVSDYVYDVGMVDTPHVFFCNDILVHNSVFYPAKPFVEATKPHVNVDDEVEMTGAIIETAKEVQSYINTSYDMFVKHFLFTNREHKFKIKQELVARTGIWLAKKKRYAQWIINKEGFFVENDDDKLDVKGIDIVRSDFPKAFRDLEEKVIVSILKGVDRAEIDTYIIDFVERIREVNLADISKPTGVKGVSSYDTGHLGERAKKTPIHVKASLTYNDLLVLLGLDKTYPRIGDGEKIRWIYLKQNQYNFSEIAFKGVDDPVEIMQFIKDYADYDRIYETQLKTKLEAIYSAIGWEYPNENHKQIIKFFQF